MTRTGKALPITLLVAVLLTSTSPGFAADEEIPPQPCRVEVTITVAPAGTAGTACTLQVAVTARGLPAGRVVWSLAADGRGDRPLPVGVTDVGLADTNGLEIPVEVAPGAVAAEIGSGDWVLNYACPATAPPSGLGGFVLRPADVTLLPAPAAAGLVRTTINAPDGWTALANVPAAAASDLAVPWFGLLSLLVAPVPPREVARIEAGAITARLFSRATENGGSGGVAEGGSGGVATGEETLTVEGVRAALAQHAARLGTPRPGEINIDLEPGADPLGAAGAALDALWFLEVGPPGSAAPPESVVPPEPAAPDDRFLVSGVWPLARRSLLVAAGLAGEDALAKDLWEESQAYRKAREDPSRPAAPPVEGAPLVSAYLLARDLGVEPVRLLTLALEARAAGVGGAIDAAGATGLLVALGSPALAGQLARGAQLPELPEEILAVADPDSDGDGLPDRLDPTPQVKGVSVVVGGRTVRWDTPPDVLGGRVMVPLRFLAERLGFTVVWDDSGRRAVVSRGTEEAIFPVDCPWYVGGGVTHYTGAATRAVGDRVVVPLRFAGMALNVWIDWDQLTRTATVDPSRPYPGPTAGGDTGPGPDPADPAAPVAYLTFDDGPNPEMTPRILAVLAEKRAPATFFVIGYLAARYPDLLRRMVAEGHALGNHTYSHDLTKSSPSWVYRSPKAYLGELDAADEAIAAATGLHPVVTRPPGGSYPYLTQEFRDAMAGKGYLTYDWDISAADSAVPRPTAEQILARIRARAEDRGRTSLVILMHDGGDDHETTLGALPLVIDLLRLEGYRLGTLTG